VFDALFVFLREFSFLACTAELALVPIQRVLLHVVDVQHLSEAEEEDGVLHRELDLLVTFDFDLLLLFRSLLLPLFDVFGFSFGLRELVDDVVEVQDCVWICLLECLEDVIFASDQRGFVLGTLLDQLHAFGLEF